MKVILTFMGAACALALVLGCGPGDSAVREQAMRDLCGSARVYTVCEIRAGADTLAGETVHVKGIVDHVCKHSNKRFKLADTTRGAEMKVELAREMDPADRTRIGRAAAARGVVKVIRMDTVMVRK
jgi:hypothetical protein